MKTPQSFTLNQVTNYNIPTINTDIVSKLKSLATPYQAIDFQGRRDGGTLRLLEVATGKCMQRHIDLHDMQFQCQEQTPEYVNAMAVITHRMSAGDTSQIFPYAAGSIENDLMVGYIPEVDKLYLFHIDQIRSSITEVRELRKTHMFRTQPTPRVLPEFINRFILSVTVQNKNVKVNCIDNHIVRYERTGNWVTRFRNDVGNTRGTTAGGIIRRIRSGSLVPTGCKLYIFNDATYPDKVIAFISIGIGAKGGHTFRVPPQSLDIYRDLVTDKFGAGHITEIDV